ncbi:hypothetical protein GCM10009844_10860 [Nocardioides koreensis]|uniref:Peptidase M15C domain-containing protein n=1 Tax=Nocardioides koreensis TaxID=433651 RepID=A0ABN2ZE94_9ACTN
MRGRRALVAFALPTVLTLAAACTGTNAEEAQDPATPRTSSAADPSSTTSSTAAAADPEHAVAPPGPRKGALGLADVLVYTGDSLSDRTVSAIRRLDGVQDVETLALAQVPIENKVITVAAVDPSTYRNFTPAASAETQEVWDRVAGGELAISPELKRKLPLDDQGYLRLGSEKDASVVHIGAFAPQVEGAVDAVVNDSWIPTLDMQPRNALLVTTGQTAPISLRKPIMRLAGKGASVQMLDAVARYGLDTSVQQTAFLVGTVADAVGTFNYTVLGGGRIAPDPAWVSSHIATESVPILGSVTCNTLIFPQLRAALEEVVQRGLADRIHPGEYAGCYYPRFIAGTTSLSNHSFGLALDLNVPGNQRGTAGEMDRTVVSIFKEWGFAWGGDWHYTDPMHFEMNALVNPR